MWAAIGERGKPFLKYVEFQEEKGPKNGVLHLQGYMECNQFIKYNVLKTASPANLDTINKRITY